MAETPFELKGKKVFVAGHGGMAGAGLVRRLVQEDVELVTAGRNEIDLRDQAAVNAWFAAKRPQAVFLAAAKVGGIVANDTLRADFLYEEDDVAFGHLHGPRCSERLCEQREASAVQSAFYCFTAAQNTHAFAFVH